MPKVPFHVRRHFKPSFNLACSLGAFMNVGLATYLNGLTGSRYLAALAGITVGAVWNYAVTSVYTWGRKGAK